MDYSKLSDFEINKLIENIVRPGWQESDYRVPNSYCNNPADAWPIIVENGIGIIPYKKGMCEAWNVSRGLIEGTTKDKNPLRAAMIVYLMMQEAK